MGKKVGEAKIALKVDSRQLAKDLAAIRRRLQRFFMAMQRAMQRAAEELS